jgi:hypothetical protein
MVATLKGLKTVALPSKKDPVMDRRMKLVKRLQEQKLLASDPGYIRVTTSFKGKGSDRHSIRKEQRVSSWARPQGDGTIIFVVKMGMSAIELEPGSGKYGVLVTSQDELPETIDALIEVTREGGFDHALSKTKTKTIKRKNSNPGTTASNMVTAGSAAETKKARAKAYA